ncbi:FHA domain-containing protein [Faecalicatena fissicatena]|uniref:FHA domain-containing protein n=1 Tax=Faecalicatena fissicatena TaxID=290055 RepID=UPI00156FAF1F|nr:FHA domain-containing protein [Faecalicatena fissicatena]NSE33519.1 FHA domain-containing protein [Faecalicatena fissicatena]
MNLCRCENGHFYDKEKYPTCPHCSGGSAIDGKPTEAWDDGPTVPMNENPPKVQPNSQPTQGGFNPNPQQTAGAFNPNPQQTAGSFNSNPQPFPPVMPVAGGFSANDMTMGVDTGDTPTVSMDQIQGGGDEDDDHTVGFFDDVFTDTTKEATKGPVIPGMPAQASVQHVNKVSTPCVGWLVALGGEHIGTDFRLKVGKNFIGRSPKMDIALTEDKSVSRERHAIVVYDPKSNMYLIQPGDSSSLAYHNNNLLLTPEKLEAYDMITVGDVNLLFMPLCSAKFSWGSVLDELKKKHE